MEVWDSQISQRIRSFTENNKVTRDDQLVAFLTSVAPNWLKQRESGSLKKRQNTADFLGVWAK